MSDARDKNGIEYVSKLVQPSVGEGLLLLIDYDGKSCEDGTRCVSPPSRNITVHVDYAIPDIRPPTDVTNITEALKIRYHWGMCGHSMTADIVRGVPVTLAGPRLSVWAVYPITTYTLPGQVPPPPAFQPPVLVRVSIGLDGTKPEPGITGNCRFTQTIGDIAQGNSATFAVPAWAVSVGLQSSVATLLGLEIQFFADPNAVLPLSSAIIGKGDTETVPVPNGALSYLIVNPAAAAAAGVRAIFTLGI